MAGTQGVPQGRGAKLSETRYARYIPEGVSQDRRKQSRSRRGWGVIIAILCGCTKDVKVEHYVDCTPSGSLIYLQFDRGAIIGAKCKYDVNGGLKDP